LSIYPTAYNRVNSYFTVHGPHLLTK